MTEVKQGKRQKEVGVQELIQRKFKEVFQIMMLFIHSVPLCTCTVLILATTV